MSSGKSRLTAAALVFAIGAPAQGALVAHYTFDETNGSVAHDSAGAVHGTLHGGAAFAPGQGIQGGAVSLQNAANGLVNMGDNFPMTGGVSFSLQAWVKLSPGDTTVHIPVSKHFSTQVAGYLLGIGDISDGCGGGSGRVSFYTAYPCSGSSATTVNDGQWHQLLGTYDASTTVTSIFVDGQLQSMSAPGNTIAPASANFLVGGITVGGNPTGTFTGLIDEVRIYGNALSASEVQALYEFTLTPVPEPASVALFLAGLASVATAFRRRRAGSKHG